MCRPTLCKTCGKTTWTGCGQHVANVKAAVPADQWCNGMHTPAEQEAARARNGESAGAISGGLLGRLFGRRGAQ